MITILKIKYELLDNNLKRVTGIESDLEFILCDLNEIDVLNKNYDIQEYHDGHYAFGSNFGFEMRTVALESGIVYRIPFISTDNSEMMKVANSISELIKLE